MRLSLRRYGATVPPQIIQSWNEERYNYARYEDGGGYGSDGSDGIDIGSLGGVGGGGIRGGRRLSRSVRRNSLTRDPRRPLDDNQSSRASLAPSQVNTHTQARRLSSSLNRRKSSEAMSMLHAQSRENTRIANTATRLKFALETHFLAVVPETAQKKGNVEEFLSEEVRQINRSGISNSSSYRIIIRRFTSPLN